jgi:hypothetical protein
MGKFNLTEKATFHTKKKSLKKSVLTWELALVHTLITQTRLLPSLPAKLRTKLRHGRLARDIWGGDLRLLHLPHHLF